MITTRYVDVAFGGGRSAMARALYQYDYGQILRITDLDLPVAYEVHFAEGKTGNSVTQIGNADGVNIPDAMLLKSGSFYAWFYLHETSSDGETRYEILFPVMQRAKPTNETPTPVQQDAITEAIAALNAAVEQTGADVEAAAASASAAADSESNSEAWAVGERDGVPVEPSDPTFHNNSAYYASVAESASQGGEAFALKAEGFAVGEQDGVPVESGSPYYHNNAEFFKNQSSGYSSNASAKASAAAGSALESEGWARGTQDGSEVSSGSPYYHNNAAYYAIDAGASAYNASVSETNAGNSATDAGNAKTAAQNAQGLAEAAKTAADADALKAEGFAVGEQNGSAVASGSPYYHNNASYYATQAGNSATSASGSATSAGADALIAEGWAKGTQNGTPVESGTYFEDNAKYYSEQAEDSATSAESAQTAAESARDAAIAATEDKAPVILDSASGAIVSISDGAGGMNARSLVAAFSPVQDLHGYENPWPAGGGANILNPAYVFAYSSTATYGLLTSVDGDVVSITGTYTGTSATPQFRILKYKIDGVETEIDFSLKPFGVTATDAGYINLLGKADTNTTITIALKNLVTDTTYDIKFRIVGYTGTAPTAWSPYSNICPISGRTGVTVTRTGKNLFDKTNLSGFGFGSGTIVTGSYAGFYCECKGGVTYTLSRASGTATSRFSIGFTKEIPQNNTPLFNAHTPYNNTDLSITATAPDDAKYVCAYFNNSGTTIPDDAAVQLELGSTVTAYEPYSGTTYPVSWQDEAGTVYGGTVDIVSGVLTVTDGVADFDDIQWTEDSARAGVFYGGITGRKNGSDVIACSALTVNNAYVVTNQDNYISGRASYGGGSVFARCTMYESASSFKTGMAGQKIIYELATPQTYQLTPTQIQMLLGANNVWSTGDTVDLTYPCDTRLYIERLTEPTEDDMTANANIASGKFFMIGNSLYYSTAAISAGQSIVVGTNCTAVSLADALNQLNS